MIIKFISCFLVHYLSEPISIANDIELVKIFVYDDSYKFLIINVYQPKIVDAIKNKFDNEPLTIFNIENVKLKKYQSKYYKELSNSNFYFNCLETTSKSVLTIFPANQRSYNMYKNSNVFYRIYEDIGFEDSSQDS
jgi:hypothetical protein